MNDEPIQGSFVSGFGAETMTHIPCPWCGAADWMLLPILGSDQVVQRPATCSACSRTGHMALTVTPGDGRIFTFTVDDGGEMPAFDAGPQLWSDNDD